MKTNNKRYADENNKSYAANVMIKSILVELARNNIAFWKIPIFFIFPNLHYPKLNGYMLKIVKWH